MSKFMTLKPRLSEKAYGHSIATNTYVFVVPGDANKHTVAAAVTAQFEVTVENVKMTNIKGKVKRTVRRSGRAVQGTRPDTKKAYVTLAEGQSLPFYEAADEAEAPAETKKEDKADVKEVKPRRGLGRRKKEEDK